MADEVSVLRSFQLVVLIGDTAVMQRAEEDLALARQRLSALMLDDQGSLDNDAQNASIAVAIRAQLQRWNDPVRMRVIERFEQEAVQLLKSGQLREGDIEAILRNRQVAAMAGEDVEPALRAALDGRVASWTILLSTKEDRPLAPLWPVYSTGAAYMRTSSRVTALLVLGRHAKQKQERQLLDLVVAELHQLERDWPEESDPCEQAGHAELRRRFPEMMRALDMS